MKLSFQKTLEGHELEFVRLMYPLRYDIFFRNENSNPCKTTVKQDETGIWNLEGEDETPAVINELSLSIIRTIEENETDQLVD